MRLGRVVMTRSGERPYEDAVGAIPVMGAGGRIGTTTESNVSPGAVLVGRVGSVGSVHLVNTPVWATDNTLVVEPSADLDPRWLAYVLRSANLKSLSQGSGTAQPLITGRELRDVMCVSASRSQQRRIADFLDDRVSRIDRILVTRREQVSLVDVWLRAASADLLANGSSNGPPLSSCATIIDTEHKSAPTVPGGGAWIAGTSAIRSGRLVRESLRETDEESYGEWTVRGRPQPGDVLLTREAPVGEVALLTDLDPAVAIGQRVVLLKPHRSSVEPGFLRLVLMAGPLVRTIDEATAGSLHPHLNMSDISRLRIPELSLGMQRQLSTRHEELLARRVDGHKALGRSARLLNEYKASLITAAVTGELDVTTAGSNIPG